MVLDNGDLPGIFVTVDKEDTRFWCAAGLPQHGLKPILRAGTMLSGRRATVRWTCT